MEFSLLTLFQNESKYFGWFSLTTVIHYLECHLHFILRSSKRSNSEPNTKKNSVSIIYLIVAAFFFYFAHLKKPYESSENGRKLANKQTKKPQVNTTQEMLVR